MTEKRVLLVHSFYRNSLPSGENSVVLDQYSFLKSRLQNVELFSRPSLYDSSLQELRTSLRSMISGRDVELLNTVKEFKPDIVHFHNTLPTVGLRWIPDYTGKLVVTHHNYKTFCLRGTLYRNDKVCEACTHRGDVHAILNRCSRDSSLSSAVLVSLDNLNPQISDYLTSAENIFLTTRMQEYFSNKVKLDKTHVIPNFLHTKFKEPRILDREEYFVYVGRLSHEKGICNLLKVWPRDLKLLIFGDGGCKTCKWPTESNILFMGMKPKEEIYEYLSRAVALIVPSLWFEGLPTVILEGLSLGTPSILSESMFITEELVENRVAASIPGNFDSCDIRSAVDRIKEIDEINTISKEFFISKYSPEIWFQKIMNVYE